VELSLDTASETASIAVSREGEVVAEATWRCVRNHTVELLPAVERLLESAGLAKADLTAVFVTIGPGLYTGLRVGVATAQGIARAGNLPLVGVGRLELDAYPHRDFGGSVVAVHDAKRGELAWAAYRDGREVAPPQLAKAGELAAAQSGKTMFVGEISPALSAELIEALGENAVVTPTSEVGRAPALAALAWQRLQAGAPHEPALVAPVYLRPPAIGPQTGS
jgi:tRNA threonylcarbamoyladenosine biosynthesis protein TsaB